MNELNRDCFIGHLLYDNFIVQILVNTQIFPLVAGNMSSTRPAYKREYVYIHSLNCTIKLTKRESYMWCSFFIFINKHIERVVGN